MNVTPGQQNQCVGVSVQYVDTGKTESFYLSEQGKLILSAGAATPRLLLPHQDRLQNPEIGKYVSDHILLPLGIYILDKEIDATSRDVYIPVFATILERSPEGQEGTVCCFDFFSGNLDRLIFIVSHLYLAFLPNCFKKIIVRIPWVFWIATNVIRWSIQGVNFMLALWLRLSNFLRRENRHKLDLVTALVKFNPAKEGCYSSNDSQIALCFFSEDENTSVNRDKEVAKRVIKEQMKLLNNLGKKPPLLIRFLIRCLTKIPYREEQVDKYVDVYSKKFLLSEQHLSGGCLFGKAIDTGLKDSQDTGKLYGATNVYVADLSSVPLPRISPQMTAYLIGFHVAKMLCSDRSTTK
ncbi:MAG: GMC oxidoreductase [Pleurocapsa sp. MO_192.B19]|nr:GMC oxidoreductase [Pleurocapsa sp. MO_192.B19]